MSNVSTSLPFRLNRHLPTLLFLFIGSGTAALIYEIVWLQLLQLVIGLTSVSLGLLLGAYMGGMCLGSLALPRIVPARHHPLRVYAFLEIGIGILALLVLWIVPWVAQIYTAHSGQGFFGVVNRGIIATICLLPPTVLMGATLPAISRWISTNQEGVAWLGVFYGGNIVGAVFGCLLAGFYLLRVHDMATATYVGVGINFVIASVGFALATRTEYSDPTRERSSDSSSANSVRLESTIPSSTRADWTVYLTVALSGMSALGAEVVWTRLLSLILGGTVYTFSIILAVFLIGLGLGSTLGAMISRSTSTPRRWLGAGQFLLMLGIAWTAYMISNSLPYWPVNPSLSLSPWFNFQLDLARCFWTILPASILWGASFPLALATLAPRQNDPGRLVGSLYAANTVGAIAGSLLFSLWLVPQTGTFWSQRILISIAALAAITAFFPTRNQQRNELELETKPSRGKTLKFAWVTVSLTCAALLAWRLSPAPWGLAAYGRFMATYGSRLAPGIYDEKAIPPQRNDVDIYCTYLGEGVNGTVAVTKWSSGVRNFHSAGKVQASNDPRDMHLQRMLGHLSALLHNKPESVLVVACGAGVTAGSFVVHPEVKRIVICDIEPLVPKHVAPMFAEENYHVTEDPRTQVIGDDGRHFIRTTQEKFDVITSDPIDPWVKGCAALNTVEYYQMCKDHLKPGGIMSLWIPLYESNSETIKSVLATFFKVFPNGIFWSNDTEEGGYDAVLFGQAEPTVVDLDQLHERVSRPDHVRVLRSLREAGFTSELALLASYAGQAADLSEWMRDAQINTDRDLRLQYLAGMSFNSYIGPQLLSEITRYCRFPENLFRGSEVRKQALRSQFRSSWKRATDRTNGHSSSSSGSAEN